jgi:hypothetical protein
VSFITFARALQILPIEEHTAANELLCADWPPRCFPANPPWHADCIALTSAAVAAHSLISEKAMNKLLAAALLPFLIPLAASSQDLSYSYIEADYVSFDIDGIDEDDDFFDDIDDGSGYGVRGSLAVSSNFFVFADYSDTQSDFTFDSGTGLIPQDQDVKRLNAGLGFRLPILSASDLVLRGAYTDIDIGDFDLGGSSDPALDDLNDDSSDGWFADAGLRSQLLPWLEASAAVRYTEIEDADQFSLVGEGLFELTQNLGLTVGFDAGDELTSYFAGVRLSFGGMDSR